MKFTVKLSRRSKRGVIALLLIVAAVTISPRVISGFQPHHELTFSYVAYNHEADELEQTQKLAIRKYQKGKTRKRNYRRPHRRFDPNEWKAADWEQVGLTPKQAAVVERYCKRTIYSNDELSQIYVIPEELYALIKDSTFYPAPKGHDQSKNHSRSGQAEATIIQIDLNTASETDLINLKGIGPFYAKKMVEYRGRLGGYTSEEQLLEIWKFDQEKLDAIRANLTIDREKIQQININTASAEELQKHPYISWNVANSIVKMRDKRQKYSNFEELLESALIDETLLLKLQPYLTL